MNRQPRNLTLYYLTFAIGLVAVLFAANHYVFKNQPSEKPKQNQIQKPIQKPTK